MTRKPASTGRSRGRTRAAPKKPPMQWYKIDLHLHTPGSDDYEEPDISYLDILRQAEKKGLDAIAITDHNTVMGCVALRRELEDLSLLERLGRISEDEKERLEEFRRLGDKVLVLPGFEFTATFGFHILAIFPPDASLRELEHVLLQLNVSPDLLDDGSTEIGASTDVTSAYRIINEAGGLVIAAHANTSHGVAMRGFPLGGQTKIAWTQDPNLHALEVTDLEGRRRQSTASFFSGSKPEYPRRMHCIQGSDAHRLTRDPEDRARLGIGDRATEVLLPELTFEALKELFLDNDFARTRPYRPTTEPFDHVQAAREQGPSIVQSFHESMSTRGGRMHAVLCDIVAFANGKGGTIYVGANANAKADAAGVPDHDEAMNELRSQVEAKVTPMLDVSIDALETKGKRIVRIVVPEGHEKPYALDESKIYVREEADTSLAVRDEIVQLVRSQWLSERAAQEEQARAAAEPAPEPVPVVGGPAVNMLEAPRTGVEIVDTVERKGTMYHTLKDLRNGNLVQNVTRSSARRLWRYAITEKETKPFDSEAVTWKGNAGLLNSSRKQGRSRYDLVQRDPDGQIHVYYGVSEDGIHGAWRDLIGEDANDGQG
jgi:PHP family Zn ribbon phosphoesterase